MKRRKTIKIGIATYADFKARTLAISERKLTPKADDPTIWFSSMESLAKVLSDKNRSLLTLIADQQPGSLKDLAALTGRAPSNLSRTLKTMQQYGLVTYQNGEGRNKAPRVTFSRLVLDVEIGAAA